jgi:hypothetical protein
MTWIRITHQPPDPKSFLGDGGFPRRQATLLLTLTSPVTLSGAGKSQQHASAQDGHLAGYQPLGTLLNFGDPLGMNLYREEQCLSMSYYIGRSLHSCCTQPDINHAQCCFRGQRVD